jgi:uncharacterized protein (TIGR02186 family)
MKHRSVVIALLFATACFLPRATQAAETATLKLNPTSVMIDATYSGTTIALQGEIPRDAEAVVKVTGWTEGFTLGKKERALGVLWTNRGPLEFENVPNVYMVYLSKNLSAAARADTPEWKKMELGFDALRRSIRISPENGDANVAFGEFLKEKKSKRQYAIHTDAIAYGTAASQSQPFHATLSVPNSLEPGTYHVEVMAFRDGVLVASTDAALPVKVTGLPGFLSELATQHGTLYGTLAIFIAIFTGLLTGALFRHPKAAH